MLGKAFLCENPYDGSIRLAGRELSEMSERERCASVGYLGHDTELLSDTVENNILLGSEGDVAALLRAVRLDGEVTPETRVGAAECACRAASSSGLLSRGRSRTPDRSSFSTTRFLRSTEKPSARCSMS